MCVCVYVYLCFSVMGGRQLGTFEELAPASVYTNISLLLLPVTQIQHTHKTHTLWFTAIPEKHKITVIKLLPSKNPPNYIVVLSLNDLAPSGQQSVSADLPSCSGGGTALWMCPSPACSERGRECWQCVSPRQYHITDIQLFRLN